MTLMNRGDLTNGFNSVGTSEWMWGSEIIESQATSWYSFFCHMDAAADAHASSCHKVVSKWLYSMIDDSDIRKQWFAPITGLSLKDEDEAISDNLLEPDMVSLNQRKFRVKAKGSWAADYIYMRGAEMVLNQAEALNRKDARDYATARTLLNDLISASYEKPDKDTEYL